MAERRMFAKTVIDGDVFLDMPLAVQALYFHLSMRADDDGFINNPKRIQKMIGCSDDDTKLLITKGFIIPFETGVVVIKHWKIHNYIQKDRYKQTLYIDEKSKLITDTSNVYKMDTEWIQDGYKMDTQVSKDKNRLDKVKNNSDVHTHISEIRKIYLGTKNKAVAEKKLPKLIDQYSKEQLIRCIERYNQYVQQTRDGGFSTLQYKNEGTFWNGGYVDYLDENVSEAVASQNVEEEEDVQDTVSDEEWERRNREFDDLPY